MDLYKDINIEDLFDEIDIAVNMANDLLRYPVWFVHTGKDSDFLRRIDESDISNLLVKLDKCKYVIKKQQSIIEEQQSKLDKYQSNNNID